MDLVRLLRPAPTGHNREAFAALVADKLRQTKTWEARLSQAGKNTDAEEKAESKAEVWRDLIGLALDHREGGIGYMALMKNLRNILEQAPDAVDDACRLLEDGERARKSLVLPFRAATAYTELQKTPGAERLLASLSRAVDNLLANVPRFSGRTAVIVDTSGSMKKQYNPELEDSKLPDRIASVFAATLYKANDADLLLFGDRTQGFVADRATPTLALAKQIESASLGGTDFHVIFKALADSGVAYDRLVILTD